MNPDLMLSVTGFMSQKGHFLLERLVRWGLARSKGQVLQGPKGDEEMPRGSGQQSRCESWNKKGGGPALRR